MEAESSLQLDHLQELLVQFKTDLLAGQKQLLEQYLSRSLPFFDVPPEVDLSTALPFESHPEPTPTLKFNKIRINLNSKGESSNSTLLSSPASPRTPKTPSKFAINTDAPAETSGDSMAPRDSQETSEAATPKETNFKVKDIKRSVLLTQRSCVGELRRMSTVDSMMNVLGAGFVRHPAFDGFCGFIICVNSVLIGVETEFLAKTGEANQVCENIQLILNSWYLLELCLRIHSYGRRFFCGEEWNWNCFDTLLVISAIVDLILSRLNSQSRNVNASFLRSVRFIRIVRTLRIIRSFKHLREFRKMVFSLMASLQTLFWSLLLVFSVMYSFALWFTQVAAYHRKDKEGPLTEDSEAIFLYYASFGRTVYSLLGAITNGYSWHELVDPWIATDHYFTVFLFFTYIALSVYGLMNIVTSVFVESAMHATRHFQDLLMDEQKREQEVYTLHLKRIFHQIDKEGDGLIDFKEMQQIINEGESELPGYLEALGISSADVWVLFQLLDLDGGGAIDIDEFCKGCLQLKGEARSFDINCMIRESRAMVKTHAEFMAHVEERLNRLDILSTTVERRVSSGLMAFSSKLDKQTMARKKSSKFHSPDRLELSNHQVCPLTPRSPEQTPRRGISHSQSDLYSSGPCLQPGHTLAEEAFLESISGNVV